MWPGHHGWDFTLPHTMSPKRGPPFAHAPPSAAGTMAPAPAGSDILWRGIETLDLDGGPLVLGFGLGLRFGRLWNLGISAGVH
uniref:Uncharacterized protein n=1 Tax=Arundo donax TaxID=35708 RepID=A0A0A9G0B3_ARUDO